MANWGFRSLTSRFIVWILVFVGGISVLTLVLSNRISREVAVTAAEREAVQATDATVNQAEEVLDAVEEGARMLAASLESAQFSDEELERLLRRFVAVSANVYGSAAAFEPRAFDLSRARFSPYVHRVAGLESPQLARADLATEAYRYWEHDWYVRPLRARAPSWSEPYFDEGGGNVVMVTYSVPVFGGAAGEAPHGVVTADLQLDWLAGLVRDFRVGRTGFAVLLSKEGRLLAHPDLSKIGVSLVEELDPAIRRRTMPIVQSMMSGGKGFEPIVLEGKEYRLVYHPVGSTGWSLAALYPEDELLEGARRLRKVQASIGIAGLAVLGAVVVLLCRRLTAPLRDLAGRARQLAGGDLDLSLPEPRSRDELGELTAAFRHMRDSLKAHIKELQEATAMRERLESELRIARRIQMGLLPEAEGGGPEAGYAVAACLVPARAIGGDLYDHFVQDGKLYFLAADVSGKGIPAALFMARAKTLFEAVAAKEPDPAAILDRVNRGLLRENEEGMFVTGICGILDVGTGELSLAVAGHDPPFLAGKNRPAAPLKVDGGPVMGLMHHAAFPTNHVRLQPGDEVVVYTDGVPEARDESESFFGPERLGEAVARACTGGAKAVTAAVLESVRAFAGRVPQADDITIFTLEFRPQDPAYSRGVA